MFLVNNAMVDLGVGTAGLVALLTVNRRRAA